MQTILYFSGTGNTEYVARRIAAGLTEKGEAVEHIPMELAEPDTFSGKSVIYLGFPIYACEMPKYVKRFISLMPDGMSRQVRLFATKAYFSGRALHRAAQLMASRGYRVISGFETVMPGSDGLAFVGKQSRTAKKLLSRFNHDIPGLREWLFAESPRPLRTLAFDPAGRVFGGVMKLVEDNLKRKFYTDDACNLCLTCIRICPIGNISKSGGEIQFGDACMLCMRCIHQCPREAIQIGRKTVGSFRYRGPDGHFRPPERSPAALQNNRQTESH